MRRTGIFSCWEFPKPFYFPSLNIPSGNPLLLHFPLTIYNTALCDFAKDWRKIFQNFFLIDRNQKLSVFSILDNISNRLYNVKQLAY